MRVSRFVNKGWRTYLVWLGIAIPWCERALASSGDVFVKQQQINQYLPSAGTVAVLNQPLYYGVLAIGLLVSLAGCYIWTRLKNRHWAFTFWGILTPIGLLGISLLKDRSLAKLNGDAKQDTTLLP